MRIRAAVSPGGRLLAKTASLSSRTCSLREPSRGVTGGDARRGDAVATTGALGTGWAFTLEPNGQENRLRTWRRHHPAGRPRSPQQMKLIVIFINRV
jgi:hypothetical protein